MSSSNFVRDRRASTALAVAFSFAIGPGQAFADISPDSKKNSTEIQVPDDVPTLQDIANTPFDFCSPEAVKAHSEVIIRAAIAQSERAKKEGRPLGTVQQDIANIAKLAAEDGSINDAPPIVDDFVSAKKREDTTAQQELLQKMTPLEHARAAQELHDWTLAIAILTPIADAGDSDAQVTLASLYSTAGRAWIRAYQPPPPGTFPPRVEALISHISLPPENETLALKYFRLAAEKRNADAEAGLALAYSCGQGIEKDYARAYAWFSLELAQRAVTIQTNWAPKDILGRRDFIANQMSPEQVQQAKRLLIQCYKSDYQNCE